jgi:hypothetical protein
MGVQGNRVQLRENHHNVCPERLSYAAVVKSAALEHAASTQSESKIVERMAYLIHVCERLKVENCKGIFYKLANSSVER